MGVPSRASELRRRAVLRHRLESGGHRLRHRGRAARAPGGDVLRARKPAQHLPQGGFDAREGVEKQSGVSEPRIDPEPERSTQHPARHGAPGDERRRQELPGTDDPARRLDQRRGHRRALQGGRRAGRCPPDRLRPGHQTRHPDPKRRTLKTRHRGRPYHLRARIWQPIRTRRLADYSKEHDGVRGRAGDSRLSGDKAAGVGDGQTIFLMVTLFL